MGLSLKYTLPDNFLDLFFERLKTITTEKTKQSEIWNDASIGFIYKLPKDTPIILYWF